MKKVYLVVAGALLFLLAACVPGATPTVRTQLPKPINFQVTEVDGGYHASWTYIADLAGVSAFNLYREETLQNGTRLGAEDRVFRITWGACEDAMCLTITDGDVDEAEAQPISVGTLECTATGCYFGYTDTAGLNSTSTYRYYLRMVNAEGRLDNQIIITEEERRLQEAAEEAAAGEAAPQPSEEGSGEENGEPEGGGESQENNEPEENGEPEPEENGESEEGSENAGENGENSGPGEDGDPGQEECESGGGEWVESESGSTYCNPNTDEEPRPGDGIACGDDLLECDNEEEGPTSGEDGIVCGDDLYECDNEAEFQIPTTPTGCEAIGWIWQGGKCYEHMPGNSRDSWP